MSEPLPNQDLPPQAPSNAKTILFMVILSFACALILSVLASVLAEPKEIAKDLDRSKQMMIAAKILSHEGYFLIENEKGNSVPAKYEKGTLVAGDVNDRASRDQLLDIYKKRLEAALVSPKGEVKTFKELAINEEEYISKYKKTGYYKEPWMLIYKIYSQTPIPIKSEDTSSEKLLEGYVVPVNGFGLWDAIYGYLAIKTDGNTVIGNTWYDQKETPGLGANIAEAYWQDLFPGKVIFQGSSDGTTDFKSAPLGIVVVKGKVAEVLGHSPKAKSSVDGMAGATLTGNGINDAFKSVLAPYRNFFIHLHESSKRKISQAAHEPKTETTG